jgi:phage tail protein X
MATTQYVAQEGERWDTVSVKAYGRASLYKGIIEANPLVPITPRLPGGTVLDIPILANVDVETAAELNPPWKQGL